MKTETSNRILRKASAVAAAVAALLVGTGAQAQAVWQRGADEVTTIFAGEMIDGAGKVFRNKVITVTGTKITAIADGKAGKADYEFPKMTVMPGLTDGHVHLGSFFTDDHRMDPERVPLEQQGVKTAENAYLTLMAGYTSVQSVGAPVDKWVRIATASGRLPGPRIRTSLGGVHHMMTPDQIRDEIGKMKADGADLIKVFASKSIRDGGGRTMDDAQLGMACSEAKKQGLRTWVHAQGDEAVRATILAGCTTVTHAQLATEETLKLAADRGVYIEPTIGILDANYLRNKSAFIGFYNYTEEAFKYMEGNDAANKQRWPRFLSVKGLKLLTGTDALAGAEGDNAGEIIWRVNNGQDAMAAILSATSVNAEAWGMSDVFGTLKPGMEADIIAVDGDPLKDITALKRVKFVMKGGTVYKNVD